MRLSRLGWDYGTCNRVGTSPVLSDCRLTEGETECDVSPVTRFPLAEPCPIHQVLAQGSFYFTLW